MALAFYRFLPLFLTVLVASASPAKAQVEEDWTPYEDLCREGALQVHLNREVITARHFFYVFCATPDDPDIRQEVVQPCPYQAIVHDRENRRFRCEGEAEDAGTHLTDDPEIPPDFIDLLSIITGIPTCGYTQRYGYRAVDIRSETHEFLEDADLRQRVEFFDWLNNGYQVGGFDPASFTLGPSRQEEAPLRFCVIDGPLTGPGEEAEADQYFYLEMYRPEAVDAGAISARIRDESGQRFDIELTSDAQFPFIFRSERLEAEVFAVRDETITVYGAALGLLDTIDILPPEDDFEITFEPLGGALVAEELHQIDLHIDAAEPDEVFLVEMEGRHAAFPEGEAGTAELRFTGALEDAGCRYDSDARTLECVPDAMGDAAFVLDVPDSATLHWQVTSRADASRTATGSLDILPLGAGTGGAQGSGEEDAIPEVLMVTLTHPQTGLDNQTDLYTRYPYRTDIETSEGNRWRYLLLVGRNLPQTRSDTVLSGGQAISYFFEESLETIGDDIRGSHLETGLGRLAGPGETPGAVLQRLQALELDTLIVFARLEDGVRPGPKRFTLNGQNILWSLEFADTAAGLSFVRAAPGDDGNFERVSETYGHESLRAELALFPPGLPYDDIPAEIEITDGDTGTVARHETMLRPTDDGRWRSDPLVLGTEGEAGTIPVRGSDGAFTTLRATLPRAFIDAELPFATGTSGTAVVLPEPDTTAWIEDVHAAAECSGYDRNDLAPDDLAFLEAAYEGGDPFSNIIILNGESVTQDVRVGHWAGLLTLRRTFLRTSSAEEQRLRNLLEDPAYLARQVAAWRQAFDAIGLDDPDSPLFSLEVSQAPLELTTSFGHVLRHSHGYAEELSKLGLDDDAIVTWFEAVGRSAVTTMLEAVIVTRNEVATIPDCDARALAEFAYGTEYIAELAVPDLMRRTSQGAWEPDVTARRWVRGAAGLARSYRQQVNASEADTDTVTLALFVLTLPLSALESAGLSAALTIYETLDAGVGVVSTVQRHQLARDDLRLALGMSATIGDARYQEALARDPSDLGTLLQAGLGTIMIGFNGYQLNRALSADEGLRLLNQIDDAPTNMDISPEGLDSLAALRDDLLQRRATSGALDPEDSARLEQLLDGEFLDGALLHRRLADAPPVPSGPAPARPEALNLSDAQRAAANAQGTSPDGIPRLLVFESDAPSLGVLDALEGSVHNQAALELADGDLVAIGAAFSETDLPAILADQTRRIMRDPNSVIGTVSDLSEIGRGRFLNNMRQHYLVEFDPLFFAGRRAFDIDWDALAILGHEIAHLVQSRFQQATGITIGRTMREFDASLIMVTLQNGQVAALGRGQAIDPRQALVFAFDYAIDTQVRAWLREGMSPRFTDASQYFDGLFQLDAAEALARARAHFPQLSERVVLEEFIAAHERYITAYSARVAALPNAGALNVIERWRALYQNAQNRLASLAP